MNTNILNISNLLELIKITDSKITDADSNVATNDNKCINVCFFLYYE